jgi:hypothetical protein
MWRQGAHKNPAVGEFFGDLLIEDVRPVELTTVKALSPTLIGLVPINRVWSTRVWVRACSGQGGGAPDGVRTIGGLVDGVRICSGPR